MRKLPLLTLDTTLPGPGGTVRPAKLSYGETLREILFSAPPGRGVVTTEAMKAFEVWQRILPAHREEKPDVLVEEADYKILLTKLEGFAWGYFNEDFAAFVLAIRGAPTIEVVAAAVAEVA